MVSRSPAGGELAEGVNPYRPKMPAGPVPKLEDLLSMQRGGGRNGDNHRRDMALAKAMSRR